MVSQKKARSRYYPIGTITGAEATDDLVLLANTSAQVEFLLHNRAGSKRN